MDETLEKFILQTTNLEVSSSIKIDEAFAPLLNVAEAKLSEILHKTHLNELTVEHRVKTSKSILFKMIDKERKVDEVYDVLGLRFITSSVEEVYEVFRIHLQKFIPCFRLMDYIAFPKVNGYRSLDYNLVVCSTPIQIQVRTTEMQKDSLNGNQSHRLRKEKKRWALREKLNDMEIRTRYKDFLSELVRDVSQGLKAVYSGNKNNYTEVMMAYCNRPFLIPKIKEKKYSTRVGEIIEKSRINLQRH
jgi:(p)ppGpp synthase/HD superfamily hydrolase